MRVGKPIFRLSGLERSASRQTVNCPHPLLSDQEWPARGDRDSLSRRSSGSGWLLGRVYALPDVVVTRQIKRAWCVDTLHTVHKTIVFSLARRRAVEWLCDTRYDFREWYEHRRTGTANRFTTQGGLRG